MVKVLSFRFLQYVGLFTMLLLQGFSETNILDIYLTTFFGVLKFENTSAMRLNFFLKMFKIGSKFRKFLKKSNKYFSFIR